MGKKRFGLAVALGLVLGCLGGCEEKEKIEIVDGHETINGEILINENNFPDDVFRKYVGDMYDEDANGRLSFHESHVMTDMAITNMGIKDLKGIECFSGLTRLLCANNQLTELDLSQNEGLTLLFCQDNQLVKLNICARRMNVLVCRNNQLAELDLSKCPSLETMDFSNNPLTKLDLSNCFENEPVLTVDPGVEVILPAEKRTNPFWGKP